MDNIYCLFLAFVVKHFICDFPLQTPYMFLNKGKYLHPGGIVHACVHGMGTLFICTIFGLPTIVVLIDAFVHYHIDWAKVRLNDHRKLTPQTDGFWILLGLDQMLHYITYVGIIKYGVQV